MADLKTLKLVCIWGHPRDPRNSRSRCLMCSKKRKARAKANPLETKALKREAMMEAKRRMHSERVYESR